MGKNGVFQVCITVQHNNTVVQQKSRVGIGVRARSIHLHVQYLYCPRTGAACAALIYMSEI